MEIIKALCVAAISFSLGTGLCWYKFNYTPPEKRTEVYILTEKDFVDVLSDYSLVHKDIPQENINISEGMCRTGLTFTKDKRLEIYDKMQKDDKLRTVPHELTHAYLHMYGLDELNTQSNDREVERKAEKIYHQVFEGGK